MNTKRSHVVLWGIGLIAFVAVIAVVVSAVVASGQGTAMAGGGPTSEPTASVVETEPVVVETEDPYPAPVATEPVVVEPTAVPTELPTVEPTVDPNLGKTEVTLKDGATVFVDLGTDWRLYPTAAMQLEFDSKVLSADNPRPANRYEPYDFVLQPGGAMLVFSEGTFTFEDGTSFTAVGGKGRENPTFVRNTDVISTTFQLSDYAATGFSVIYFESGSEPNVELWSRYPIGRPTHCGIASLLTNGCSKVTTRDVILEKGKAEVVEDIYEDEDALPIDNTALAEAQSNSDWESKTAAMALVDEFVLLNQEPETLGAQANIGVTYSKPVVVVCEGGTFTGPNEVSQDMPVTPGVIHVAVFWNKVGNTAVYRGSNLEGCTMYEYAPDNIPHSVLFARAAIGIDGISEGRVYVFSYGLLDLLKLGTEVETEIYDTPLGGS